MRRVGTHIESENAQKPPSQLALGRHDPPEKQQTGLERVWHRLGVETY